MWIEAAATEIDGAGGVLAQASPSAMRDPSLGAAPLRSPAAPAALPGFVEVDRDDLRALERNGTLVDVITHEMGHALGFGTLWEENNLVRNAGSTTRATPAPSPSRSTTGL